MPDIDLIKQFSVSRETVNKIEKFIELLFIWQKKINLISIHKKISFEDFREIVLTRHVMDSMQIAKLMQNNAIVDVGSGGGFPGLILSIMLPNEIRLVESDIRKCEFLKECVRQLSLNTIVDNRRIEQVERSELPNNTIITSRACASITKLLSITSRLHFDNSLLLLKGEKAQLEIEEARLSWAFDVELSPSLTSDNGSILHLKNIKEVCAHG